MLSPAAARLPDLIGTIPPFPFPPEEAFDPRASSERGWSHEGCTCLCTVLQEFETFVNRTEIWLISNHGRTSTHKHHSKKTEAVVSLTSSDTVKGDPGGMF